MEVQRDGCRLLAAWGKDDAVHFERLLTVDGLATVVEGMRRHTARLEAQEEATELLRSVAQWQESEMKSRRKRMKLDFSLYLISFIIYNYTYLYIYLFYID